MRLLLWGLMVKIIKGLKKIQPAPQNHETYMILCNKSDVVFRNHLVSKTPHLLILGLTEQNSTISPKDCEIF